MIPKHQGSRVEVALGADPDVMADLVAAVEAPLDEGLAADEDAFADLEGLGCLKPTPGSIRSAAPQDRVRASQRMRRMAESSTPCPWMKRP